ncbi:MAG: hypothetical protein JWM76_3957 [Pseudonocardiales bacterium]|nr:hypothetical protein [Pseudonocardiales bacterium]
MSGLDTSQPITDEASLHAEEMHVHSRPHQDVSGKTPEEVAASHTPDDAEEQPS